MKIEFSVVVSDEANYIASNNNETRILLSKFNDCFENHNLHEIIKFSFNLDLIKHKSRSIIYLESEGSRDIFILLSLQCNNEQNKYEYFCYSDSMYFDPYDFNGQLDDFLCYRVPHDFNIFGENNNKILIYGVVCKINFPKINILEKDVKNIKIVTDIIEYDNEGDFYCINNAKIR